jgi:hypothetical protein
VRNRLTRRLTRFDGYYSIDMDHGQNYHPNHQTVYAEEGDKDITKQLVESILAKSDVYAVICHVELLEALAERYPRTDISTTERGYIGNLYYVPFYVDERFDTTYILHSPS